MRFCEQNSNKRLQSPRSVRCLLWATAPFMPRLMCCVCMCVYICVCFSEPPVWLRPAGCWKHGEGGRALETSSLPAWVCAGGPHPAEQVSRRPHGKRPPLWVTASLDSSPFITLYLFLSQLSHGFLSHTLMGVIFFIAPFFLVTLSCFLPPPLVSAAHRVSFFSLPSRDRAIHPGSTLTSVHESAGCSGEPPRHVAYVEHVVVGVTIAHGRRGDLSITLTSPSGTVSQLLANR